MKWSNPYFCPEDVVCKTVKDPKTIERLKNEAGIYTRQLKELQGKRILLFHGLHEGMKGMHEGEPIACIILDYCGIPFEKSFRGVDLNFL